MNIFGTISNFFIGLAATALTLVGVQTPLTTGIAPGIQVSLDATKTVIVSGESVVLSWDAINATTCSSAQFSVNGLSGSATVSPTQTTTYIISCSVADVSDSTLGTEEPVSQDVEEVYEWKKVNSYFSKICSANNDPEFFSTSIQQPFCEDYEGGGVDGYVCSEKNAKCKDHGYQGKGACSGLGTVYGTIVTYKCTLPSTIGSPDADNIVTDQVTVVVSQSPATTGTSGGGNQCSDAIDNDNDGRIDGADFGCQLPGSSKESPNPQCSDGIDNNNNGLTDSADIGACSGPTDNNERFADGSTMLEVPALVQRDEMATLTWSVQNVRGGTCTLTGTNGDSWNLSGASGVVTSSKMQNEATFTITCTDLNAQKVTVSKTVKIAPTFKED